MWKQFWQLEKSAVRSFIPSGWITKHQFRFLCFSKQLSQIKLISPIRHSIWLKNTIILLVWRTGLFQFSPRSLFSKMHFLYKKKPNLHLQNCLWLLQTLFVLELFQRLNDNRIDKLYFLDHILILTLKKIHVKR
jgi:hypothetical protein